MPTLKTPTVNEGITGPGVNRLLARYHIERGVSLIKKNGHWTTTRFPWAGDLESLTEGTDYFIGGHTYTIDSATAASLTADGFGAYIT